ncbi:hypothetical protein O7626_39970 [Micromonospora sp. WMMD1102]|uniref:hypothetical protein n=1 Tax=Micromonospora sp. WMMD1102 TaxID=3016105 RepID=UPI0024152DF5|nr:hypothetical protein [Micromonospora sp. WMMD1102]MDG4791994.1 hypothetical protein [Micromonospora sp. WMMD1102]
MSDLLNRISAAVDGLCPCGAPPADGSAYCSDDCRPTHISEDTDQREAGDLATPMRWRPDLVTEADDTDLIPLGTETLGYRGRFHAQLFEHRSNPDRWHLRLDDGHRFVGCDLDGAGGRQDPITDGLRERVMDAWQRLERELVNPRHIELDNTDPFADVMPPRDTPRSDLFTWTRRCRACGRRSQPVVGHRVRLTDPARVYSISSITDLGADLIEDIETCDLCVHCRTPFRGPSLAAVVYYPDDAGSVEFGIVARLVLRSPQHQRERVVTDRELAGFPSSPRELVEWIWDEMERSLLRLTDSEPSTVPPSQPSSRVFFAPPGTDPVSPADNGQWAEATAYLTDDGLAAAVGLSPPMGRDEVMARFREAYERARTRSRGQQ